MREQWTEVTLLHEVDTAANALRGINTRLEGLLINVFRHGWPNIAEVWRRADTDQEIIHAALRDYTHLKSLLDAEQQRCQVVKRTLTHFADAC